MGDTDVIVACPFHQKTLVSGLWNLFVADQGVDFFLQWGDQAVRAHRLVVDAFLSSDTIGSGAPAPSDSGQHDDLDAVFQFIYKGRVTLSRAQLERCLGLAKQLDFKMLIDAICAYKVDPDATYVTISSPLHHPTLVDKLWNSFTAERGINFFLSWKDCPMAAHKLLVDVFLHIDNLVAAPSDVPKGKTRPTTSSKCSIDHLIEFMYRGRVMVQRDQLMGLLKIAREFDFDMLVEAVECARKDLGITDFNRSGIGRGTVGKSEKVYSKRVKPISEEDSVKSSDDSTSDESFCPDNEHKSRTSKVARKPAAAVSKFRRNVSKKKDVGDEQPPLPDGSPNNNSKRKKPVKVKNCSVDSESDDTSSDDSTTDESSCLDKRSKSRASKCDCVLEQLLTESFAKRDLETKKAIAKTGRPTPPLPKLITGNVGFVRHFQDKNYAKIDWLTGCPRLNRLYCWPCVLFSTSFSAWDRLGYGDLNNFHNSAMRHGRSMNHSYCVRLLAEFCGNSTPSSAATALDSSLEHPPGLDGPTNKSDDSGQSAANSAEKIKAAIKTMCDQSPGCIIEQLLEEPFYTRDSHNQVRVAHGERPTPSLPGLKKEGRGFVRRFQDNLYEKSNWLTGCQKVNRLYCWPCLLLAKEAHAWSRQGYCDLNNLHNSIQRHGRSQKHIACVKELTKLKKTVLPPAVVDPPPVPQSADDAEPDAIDEQKT